MGLTGFDFQKLNRYYLSVPAKQPVNEAVAYGASIIPVPTGRAAWRCIGVYHLTPDENRGRHNVFVDVLDEAGNRTKDPVIYWTWWIDGPTQIRKLDKPADEPACDIPLESKATVTLKVAGGDLPSDVVGNLHSRHPDEDDGNTYGHHSFYVVFQRQAGGIVEPPVEPDELDRLRKENVRLKSMISDAISLLGGAL